MTVTYVSTLDAKEGFSELVNRVTQGKERIVLTRRGKEVAAIIPIEDFALLQKSQSQSDLQEAADALQEARNDGAMTLKELKDEIG